MTVNIAKISGEINELSPNELYNLYRYINTIDTSGNPVYEGIKSVLGYKEFVDRATTVIEDAKKLQEFHNIVNKITGVVGAGIVPVAVTTGIAGTLQKGDTNEMFEDKGRSK